MSLNTCVMRWMASVQLAAFAYSWNLGTLFIIVYCTIQVKSLVLFAISCEVYYVKPIWILERENCLQKIHSVSQAIQYSAGCWLPWMAPLIVPDSVSFYYVLLSVMEFVGDSVNGFMCSLSHEHSPTMGNSKLSRGNGSLRFHYHQTKVLEIN